MKKFTAFLALIMVAVFVISSCTPEPSESAKNSSATSKSAVNSSATSISESTTSETSSTTSIAESTADTSSTSDTSEDNTIKTVEYGDTLKNLINAGWKRTSVTELFGDSVYLRLYHNFDNDGVKVRFAEQYSDEGPSSDIKNYTVNLTGNVENIIITNKFKGEIFKGITMKSTKQDIVRLLGNPNFKDDTLELFGFKTNDVYAFFYGNTEIKEVSIYPVYQMKDITSIFNDIKSLCKKSEYSQTLADDIAKLLSEKYDFYNYNFSFSMNVYRSSERSQSTGIAYYGNGIQLRYSAATKVSDPMLVVYGSNVSKELRSLISSGIKDKNNKTIVGLVDNKDLALEHEKDRIIKEKDYAQSLKSVGVISPNKNITLHYEGNLIYANDTGINVFYKDNEAKSFTIIASPWEGNIYWLNDRYFIFGYSNNYLAIYDLQKNKRAVLGNNLVPIEVSSNTIKAKTGDEVTVIPFSFKANGDIQMNNIVWE